MTSELDPPRLRTLEGELPSELLLAVGDAPGENATPAELMELGLGLRGALNDAGGDSRRSGFVPRRPARGRAAVLVLTFAFGAGAGVLVSGGIFLASRGNAVEPATSPVASGAQPERLAPGKGMPAASPAVEPPADDAPPPPLRPAREPARSPVQNPGADLPAEPESATPSDREELALLARAQGALASNPGLSLALSSDHERKFPQGALVQEREVVAIDALLRLGRRAEASARAERFHRQFPTSVHGRRLDVLLGSEKP